MTAPDHIAEKSNSSCTAGAVHTLGAVAIAAAVISDERVAAFFVLTARNMPAERGCAASLDRTHHLQLTEAHVTGIGATPRRPEVAKDVRDLQRGARQQRRRLCRRFDLIFLALRLLWRRQLIERALDGRDQPCCNARISCCRLQLLVTERARVIMHILLTH